MKQIKQLLALVLFFSVASCNNSASYREAAISASDSATGKFLPSAAAKENNKDNERKFIRTAEMKFRVKNVARSTYDIEDITNRQGGFVTYTNLTSNVKDVTTTAISADSSLETTNYEVTNTITVRVPNTKLDTTLKEIAKNVDFLDYRIIKAEDVALQILANDLTRKRSARNEERLTRAIDNRGKKLIETTDAEDVLLSKQEEADNAKISNLSLKDQVNFSTVNLSIYQRQSVKRELISNDKNIDAYEPGLGSKLLESLKYGWNIMENCILFFVRIWGLLLFALIAFVAYRRFRQQSPGNKNKA